MPLYQIPPTAKRFEIVKSKAGEYFVVSETTGRGGVVIPVRDQQEAEQICDRLNRGEHDGTVET